MKKRFLFFTIACTLAFSSCSQTLVPVDSKIDTEATVFLDEKEMSLQIGDIGYLTAYLNSEADKNTKLKWNNSDSTVVDLVTYEGEATIIAKSVGVSYVSVQAGASFSYCIVTVGGSYTPITITSLSLDEVSKTIDVGTNFSLTAIVEATGGTPSLKWTSGNSDIASVTPQTSKTALVSGVGAGVTTISVASGSFSATCEVTVENNDKALSVRLNKSTVNLVEGGSETLIATTKPSDAVVSWESSNTSVATVNNSGKVDAVGVGTAVVTASVTDGTAVEEAKCNIAVSGQGVDPSTEYPDSLKQPGHLYLHYLRTSAPVNYDKWALWMWPNYPIDGEGSLWAANTSFNLQGITPETTGFMTNAQVNGSSAANPDANYIDDNGVIVDVDLTLQSLHGGKTGKISPLIDDSIWNDTTKLNKAALGFLIVDQSKMTGDDMWESDGGAETYIKRIGKLLPDGKNSYMHVYCVEGNVADFSTSSGKQEFINPTATDTSKQYVSKNDITDLTADKYPSGVSTSASFLEDKPGVGYQIFVPSFCDSDGDGYGDIKGITSKLDYLEDLGVEVLWLTPIQESNSYHGYDVTDYYKIDQRFGTLADYQELLFEAHHRGMKVLMDMVINHTSKSNVLFKKSQRAETETINGHTYNYRNMYLWKYAGDKVLEWNGVDGKYDDKTPATYTSINVEDSDDWYKDGSSNYYYFGKFGSGMAELNYSCQDTRDYMIDMCKYWLSFGLDGFRLDAIKHIYLLAELDPTYNYSGHYITYDVGHRTYYNEEMGKSVTVKNDYTYDRDLNVKFWKQFSGALKSAYPDCFLVGENFDGWDARIAPFYESMDSQFDFSTYYHLNEMKPDSIGSSVKHSLTGGEGDKGYYDFRSNGINGAFTSNHDIARMMNHAAAHYVSIDSKYGGGDGIHHREVVTTITPDNKDTSTSLADTLKSARYYATVSILTPGLSWIYYGDELGMTGNLKDLVQDSTGVVVEDHGNNIDRWYRQPMRWGTTYGENGVVKYSFSGMEVLWDKINQNLATASTQQADENSLFSLFKELNRIKNLDAYPTYGRVVNAGSCGTYGSYMEISDGTHTVRVRINNSDSDFNLDIPDSGQFLGGSKGATNGKVPARGFHVIKA